ncbi:ISAs1 family transposase [Gallaecimonas sp. GXIMD4217]|uniref:ISAs1 family transposase n=1 Tax=Gallaecimonas sp. GXIMD4217 TaxID=3131927 RepID=UPI00311B19E7
MSLFDHLTLIEDTRSPINRQHNLVDVIFLVMSAMASGCEGWLDIEEFGHEHLDWLRQHRPFEAGIPTRHSIARIIKAVDAQCLVLALFSWVNHLRQANGRQLIAIDGKTLRGAVNQQGKEQALHLISAFDTEQGVTLFQQATATKGGELVAVRELLTMLDIRDAVLTFDALHCNKETLHQISKRKGDYIVQVKGNQPSLREAIEEIFQPYWDSGAAGLPQHEQTEQGHGRQERRTVFQLPATLSKELAKKWPSAKSVIAVERERRHRGRTSIDTHYYLSSLDIDPAFVSDGIRQHWHIENQQHWVLDVTFREDCSRIGDRENAKKMALLRRIVLNLLQQHPLQVSKPSKRRKAAWNGKFRSELFFG